MYKILDSKYDSQTGKRVCDVYADTEADLPNASQIAYEFMDMGSFGWIAEDRTFKTLNSEGRWVPWRAPVNYHIYGVSWDFNGKQLTRTNEAASFGNPVPYVNNGSMTAADCSSPFDNIAPWKDMARTTDALGNELVAIPKFWYKFEKTAQALNIQIADGPAAGFNVSPAHKARGNESKDKDVIYIGRYHSDSSYKSTSGSMPVTSITRGTARTNTHNLGNEYWQLDFRLQITLWLLYIVEFANWDSQSMIGYNCGSVSSAQNSGSTDTMPYHTGTMQSSKDVYGVGVQYRYIEDPWGNVFDWCDGVTFNNADIYCFDNFADYSDNYQSTGATLVGTRPTTSGYIQSFNNSSVSGFEWFIYPDSIDSNQEKVCDGCYYGATGTVLDVGANYGKSLSRGLFCLYGTSATDGTHGGTGVRLQRRPSD